MKTYSQLMNANIIYMSLGPFVSITLLLTMWCVVLQSTVNCHFSYVCTTHNTAICESWYKSTYQLITVFILPQDTVTRIDVKEKCPQSKLCLHIEAVQLCLSRLSALMQL